MVNLQVLNIPDELYQRIRWLAAKRNSSVSSVVLEAVDREIRQEEWWNRWDSLPKFDGEVDSVALIREVREENDRKLTEYWDL